MFALSDQFNVDVCPFRSLRESLTSGETGAVAKQQLIVVSGFEPMGFLGWLGSQWNLEVPRGGSNQGSRYIGLTSSD